jgi:hypothetical protein
MPFGVLHEKISEYRVIVAGYNTACQEMFSNFVSIFHLSDKPGRIK